MEAAPHAEARSPADSSAVSSGSGSESADPAASVATSPRAWERAAILGTGVGLTLGSLAMWTTDAKTATAGSAAGLLILALVLASRRRASP